MADTPDLGSGAERRGGSSPPSRIFLFFQRTFALFCALFWMAFAASCSAARSTVRDPLVIQPKNSSPSLTLHFDRWRRSHTQLIRDVRRELGSASPQSKRSAGEPDFSLHEFDYFSVEEQGYPQAMLVRSPRGMPATSSSREIVTSPALGANGYPLLTQRLAVCPTEQWAAFSGTIGDMHVLCVREPTTNRTDCAELSQLGVPDIGALQWDADCSTLFFTRYENGRAAALLSVKASKLGEGMPAVRLAESDAAFSLSLRTSEDTRFFVISNCSAVACDVLVLPTNNPDQTPQVVIDRHKGRLLSLHRAFDSWWAVDTSPSPSGSSLLKVSSLFPFNATPFLLPSFALNRLTGFRSFALLEGREDDGRFGLRRLGPDGALKPIALPARVGRLSVRPVQEYGEDNPRLTIEGPDLPPQASTLSGLRAEMPRLRSSNLCQRRGLQPSADGENVPYTLLWRPALAAGDGVCSLPGSFPSAWLLHLYGAYGQSLDARFNSDWQLLFEHGIGVALAHVRGGGERGTRWHSSALGAQRIKSVQDLLAVAKTIPATRVALFARSAGALTATMAIQQQPGLFSGALMEVPFLDVLATLEDPSRPSSRREIAEWGDPSLPDVRAFWREHSPEYASWRSPPPPLFLSLAEHDEAVSSVFNATWAFNVAQRFPDRRPLVQWIEDGTHAGAAHVSDDLQVRAEQLAWLLTILKP